MHKLVLDFRERCIKPRQYQPKTLTYCGSNPVRVVEQTNCDPLELGLDSRMCIQRHTRGPYPRRARGYASSNSLDQQS